MFALRILRLGAPASDCLPGQYSQLVWSPFAVPSSQDGFIFCCDGERTNTGIGEVGDEDVLAEGRIAIHQLTSLE